MVERKEVEAAYGVRIDAWRPYRDVVQAHTAEHGWLCIKPCRYPPEELEFLAAVLDHLRGRGFTASPRLYRTKDGRPFREIRSGAYMVTPWILGSSPDFRRESERTDAVQLLARFHTHAQGLRVVRVPPRRDALLQMHRRIARCEHLLSPHLSRKEARLVEQMLAFADDALHSRLARLALTRERAVRAFDHGDYNYPNLVRDHRGRLHVIDFDNARLNVRMADLAHLIHRNCAWETAGTERLIAAYQRVRPLTSGERRLLCALLAYPYPLVRAVHQGRSVHSVRPFRHRHQVAAYLAFLREQARF
ncbi:MAG: phosphotransferase [Alicyclobacillus sp.]|nr:phosphotransferase [Alicyclobacillus sp.]